MKMHCSSSVYPHPRGLRPAIAITLLLSLAACGGESSKTGLTNTNPNTDPNAPAPTLTLGTSAGIVNPGDSVTLTWSTTNASSCLASDGWTGSKPTSGSEQVGPINQATSFSLSCSGDGGGTLQQVSVQVDQGSAPTVSLNASPINIATGSTSTLSWTATNADSCTASSGWSGTQPVSGSLTVGPLNSDTSYQLTCTGPSGNGVGMVTVRVFDKTLRWQAPTQNVDGTTLNDLAGYKIYWGSASRVYDGSGSPFVINSASVTEWEATMPPGEYFIAMKAFDGQNNESAYSNEIQKIIP